MRSTKIIPTYSPAGKKAAPYQLHDDVLIKRVRPDHIWRARQAVGVDEDVYQRYGRRVQIIRFEFWDKRVYEITREEFEKRSLLYGDNIVFSRTRFIRLSDLRLVKERSQGNQLALFAR